MDDFVLNVREIAQFAAKDTADPTDAFMLQSGGLGGAYCWTTASGIVSPYLDPVVATFTADVQALQTTDSDLAATISGNYAALSDAIEQQGATLQAADQALQQQLLNARLNSVWSFNGRTGNVQLTGADVFNAGAAPLKSPNFYDVPTAPNVDDPNQSDTQIANTAFVQRAAIARLADFMGSHPITWTFNGRTGDVLLKAKDVSGVGGVLRQKPYVPTPSISNYSDRIATTKWVMWHLDDLSVEIDDLRAKVEQEIDESALATKAYVDTTFVTRQNSTLGGYATAPTPPLGTNNAQVATTAFVMNQIAESTAGVASFNGRTGNVTLEATDLGPFNLAPLDSPVFTGIPTAPTAAIGTTTDQLATCAFVANEVQAIDAGVALFNGRSGIVTLLQSDVAPFLTGLAPLDSPVFTGTPQVPTASAGTATNQAASTAFVTTAITNAIGQAGGGVTSFNGRSGAVSLLANDISAVGGALLASPAFTGVPTAPTAVAGTNSTQLATTAFVQQALTGLNLGVQTFNGRSGNVTLQQSDLASFLAPYLLLSGGQMSGPIVVQEFVQDVSDPLWWEGFDLSSVPNFITSSGFQIAAYLASGVGGGGVVCGGSIYVNGYLGVEEELTVRGQLDAYWDIIIHEGNGLLPDTDGNGVVGFPGISWDTMSSYNYAEPSDPRLKQMLPALPDALAKVVAIPVEQFVFTRDASRKPRTGFDASKVQPVFPNGVVVGKDEQQTLAICLGDMLALLWQAVQELAARVDQLQAA